MAASPAALQECVSDRGNCVRVEFHQRGDRFEHTIFGGVNGEVLPLLTSFESDADEVFPMSPPWSDLHQQDESLFCTGATTQAHWSMSVQVARLAENDLRERLFDKRYGLNEAPKHQKELRFLEFNVACRLKSKPARLGSIYQLAESASSVPLGLGREIISSQKPAMIFLGSISLEQTRNCRVGALTCEPKQLQVTPAKHIPESFPATIQWKYGICWALAQG